MLLLLHELLCLRRAEVKVVESLDRTVVLGDMDLIQVKVLNAVGNLICSLDLTRVSVLGRAGHIAVASD